MRSHQITLAKELLRHLKSRSITNSEFAHVSGIHSSQIYDTLNRKTRISKVRLVNIARALKLNSADSDRLINLGSGPHPRYFEFKTWLTGNANTLSQQNLEDINSIAVKALKRRFAYGYNQVPKYGNLNRNFTEDELQKFFDAITKERYHRSWKKYLIAFKMQAYLGLRIGEVCAIKTKDINLQTRELVLTTEKARRLDRLLIPTILYYDLVDFIQENEPKIHAADDYLLYSDRPDTSTKAHIGNNELRKVFRETAKKAGIEDSYGESEETANGRRPLYRLTTHSLRHYAITRFYRACKDIELTNMFARHSKGNLKDTMRYIGSNRDTLYKNIDLAFGSQSDPVMTRTSQWSSGGARE